MWIWVIASLRAFQPCTLRKRSCHHSAQKIAPRALVRLAGAESHWHHFYTQTSTKYVDLDARKAKELLEMQEVLKNEQKMAYPLAQELESYKQDLERHQQQLVQSRDYHNSAKAEISSLKQQLEVVHQVRSTIFSISQFGAAVLSVRETGIGVEFDAYDGKVSNLMRLLVSGAKSGSTEHQGAGGFEKRVEGTTQRSRAQRYRAQ